MKNSHKIRHFKYIKFRASCTYSFEINWLVYLLDLLDILDFVLELKSALLSTIERHKIEQAIQGIPNLFRTEEELPPPSSYSIPYLADPKTDGLKCHKCSYICSQVQKMQSHCRISTIGTTARGRIEQSTRITPQTSYRGGKMYAANGSLRQGQATAGLKLGAKSDGQRRRLARCVPLSWNWQSQQA